MNIAVTTLSNIHILVHVLFLKFVIIRATTVDHQKYYD
jgi:hypothetical protein